MEAAGFQARMLPNLWAFGVAFASRIFVKLWSAMIDMSNENAPSRGLGPEVSAVGLDCTAMSATYGRVDYAESIATI